MSRFSIVTCTWNSALHLPKCIASVLAQRDADFEWIFVDGGSTDATLELISSIERPVVLIKDIRGGVSRAMNVGIQAASGDIVSHLHGDDYYLHSGVLKKVNSIFENSHCAWVVGQIQCDRAGSLLPSGAPHKAFSNAALASGRFFVPHQATFVKRSVFAHTGCFDESLKYAMDWDLWFRIAALYSPQVLNEDIAVFRNHAGSLSSADAQSRLAAMREELHVRMRYARRTPLHSALWLGRYLLRTRRLRRQLNVL